MKLLLGFDRTFLWALRGVLRVFVRATVVPEDALVRLHGRARRVSDASRAPGIPR